MCYDETELNYVANAVKKVKSQMKAKFPDQSNSISIIGFVTTFKFACDTNRIHEKAVMLALPFLIKNGIELALNRRV